jgi:hypothetical protein
MRKLLLISFSLILTFTLFLRCNNELDVTDTWKEVPVLYGMLNPTDSIHIIKVTKAFLGDGNALIMAQNPDSSYYGDELKVTLTEIDPNGWYNETWDFDTMWIHDKLPGIFYSGDQKLYCVKAKLNTSCKYLVRIVNTKTGLSAYATTSLIGPITIKKPRGGLQYYSFTSTAELQSEVGKAANGKVYQMVIRFNYTEVNLTTSDTAYKYVDWIFPNKRVTSLSENETETVTWSYPGTGFYSNIQAKVKEDPNIKRIPGKVNFTAYAGGDELSTYIDITSPINSIVTDRPDYTNVSNGRGLLSSRSYKTHILELNVPSMDTLVKGSKTYKLGFVYP